MRIHATGLLFDNDGTLVSSLDSVVRTWTRWAGEYGVTAEDFARVGLHGRPAAEIVADLLPAEQVPAALDRVAALELADVAEGGVEALPGATRLLRGLPSHAWAVVTSATRALATARLRRVGIAPLVLVAADDITRGKPDPEPYLLGAARLGRAPSQCVVFEDAPAGLEAGRAAGMWTVGLATTHPAEELVADLVVPSLSAISAQVTADGWEISAVV